MTDALFKQLQEMAKNRQNRYNVIGRTDTLEYQINYHKKQITLTGIKDEGQNCIEIPGFITHISSGFNLYSFRFRQILKIKVGKHVVQLQNLLNSYCGGVVEICGGSENLIDLQQMAIETKLDLLEINFDKQVRPLKMEKSFLAARIHEIRFQSIDFQRVSSIYSWMYWAECQSVLDFQSFSAPKLSNLQSAFEGCKAKEIKLFCSLQKCVELKEQFKRSKVRSVEFCNSNNAVVCNVNSAFEACDNLEIIKFKNLDFQKVQQIEYIFQQCGKLSNLDKILENIDLSSVECADAAFKGCDKLKAFDFRKCKLIKVRSMREMFESCLMLREVHIGNTQNYIESAENMFGNCVSLKVASQDSPLRLYKRMRAMFYGTRKLIQLDAIGLIEQCSSACDMHYFMYGSGCISFKTDFNFDIDCGIVVNNQIQECEFLRDITFTGKVTLGSRYTSGEALNPNKSWIKNNKSLEEINFIGGLHIKQKKIKFNMIQGCNNLRIIRSQNKIDIEYVLNHLASFDRPLKGVYSYKQDDLYVYELIFQDRG